MRTAEIKLYTFDELSEDAKSRALDWWRSCQDADDLQHVIDDAVTVGEMLGIEFAKRTVPLMDGSTRQEPKIWWSGFCLQGDGACFEGSYGYKAGSAAAIRKHAPEDKRLHRIAADLQHVQRTAFYKLWANVSHNSRYYHARSTSIEVERIYPEIMVHASESQEDAVSEALWDFMDWIYHQLEQEYDYQNSDEQVAENIRANEIEFTENGQPY